MSKLKFIAKIKQSENQKSVLMYNNIINFPNILQYHMESSFFLFDN